MWWHKIIFERETGRLRCWWRALAYCMCCLLVSIALTALFLLLLLPTAKDTQHATVPAMQLALAIFSLAIIPIGIIIAIWALRVFERLPSQTLGLTIHRFWTRTLLGSFAVGALLLTLPMGLLYLTGLAQFHVTTLARQDWYVIGGIAVSFLVNALVIEVVFHGYVFQTMLRGIGPLAALLLTSLFGVGFFILLNPNFTLIGMANVLLLFVLSGMLYLRLGSLWPAVGLNAGWNIAQAILHLPIDGQIMLDKTPLTIAVSAPTWISGGAFGPEGGAAVSVVLLAVIAVAAYSRLGLPLESYWWEWRQLAESRPHSPCWDFTIGSRHYQWKLVARDTSN